MNDLQLIAFIVLALLAVLIIIFCICSTRELNENEEANEENILLEIPEEHIYTRDESEEKTEELITMKPKVYYTEETITRPVLIKLLNEHGITGVSRLKKSELINKMLEANIAFPEVVDEQNQSNLE